MTAMLHRLVEDVATEIQARLPREWLPANEDLADVIDRLTDSRLLDIEELMALLLRRADEERIMSAFNARPGARGSSIIQPLVSGDDARVAAAAMALLIAAGRRRDRYGRSIVELNDVPASAAGPLVHAVAAALSERKPPQVPMVEAERQLSDAAKALLLTHDPARSLDHLGASLARLLDEAGRLDDAWIRLAIDSADIAVLGHALARRGGVDAPVAIGELLSGDARRVMLLFRLAAVPRDLAGRLLAALGDLLGLSADAHALAIFDGIGSDRTAAARDWLGLDPDFKQAVKALGHGHGSF